MIHIIQIIGMIHIVTGKRKQTIKLVTKTRTAPKQINRQMPKQIKTNA